MISKATFLSLLPAVPMRMHRCKGCGKYHLSAAQVERRSLIEAFERHLRAHSGMRLRQHTT